MMMSLAYVIVFGLIGAWAFKFIRVPGLVGMIVAGVLIGPEGLGLLDDTMLAVSEDLRKIALIIILLRAGLGLNRRVLKDIGKKASALSIIPVMFEGFAVALLTMWLFDFDFVRAGMIGFIIAAVSPAVIVPAMLTLMKRNVGKEKNVPPLVLSAASVDDVVAITMFSTFVSVYFSTSLNVTFQIMSIPLSVVLGIVLGMAVGYALVWLFIRYRIRDTKKIVLLIAFGILMVGFADALEDYVLVASLLGVMALGVMITEFKRPLGERLSLKLDKVWVFAELFLFVLVGAALELSALASVGLLGVVVIAGGVFARSLGVWLATLRSDLNRGERAFVAMAFLPKATVQAAVGAIPLSLGVPGGEIMLALSVLAIVLTAPVAAALIRIFATRLLGQPANTG